MVAESGDPDPLPVYWQYLERIVFESEIRTSKNHVLQNLIKLADAASTFLLCSEG